MNRYVRRTLAGLKWVAGIAIVWITLQTSVLAFPQPWFDQSVRDGNLTFYFDGPADPGMVTIHRGVRERLEAVEIYDESVDLRVFVCHDQGLYKVFARLALVPTRVPGFNLSLLNNTFASAPRIADRRRSNYAGIENSALAGDLEHSIAHELVHDLTQEKIGVLAYRRIPAWKTEGFAEYSAGRSELEQDTAEPLSARIFKMQTALTEPRAREYYRWSLVVEFLSVEMGHTFAEIFAAETTLDDATSLMMTWYHDQSSSPIASSIARTSRGHPVREKEETRPR